MSIPTIKIPYKKAAFWSLIGVIIASAVLYVVFVTQTINNVVERKQLESEISSLSIAVSEMEFQYISYKNDITLEKAYDLGFKESPETHFASRGTRGLSVNIR